MDEKGLMITSSVENGFEYQVWDLMIAEKNSEYLL